MARPLVAIVGRPNVGKSTLFNRFLGRREAIVEHRPGVTRDRNVAEVEWCGVEFDLADTGGWIAEGHGTDLDRKVSEVAERAISDADLVLFVVDASMGVTGDDDLIAHELRKSGKTVLSIANKADNADRDLMAWEFISLGFGDPVPISALHGRNTGDLLDLITGSFPAEEAEERGDDDSDTSEDELKVASIALVGRPNVGKSTLFNRLIGDDRAVVHDMPGTTRDSVDTIVQTPDGPLRFIDTAGMRRKAKIDEATEYYSMVRALRSVDGADVALLVIDAVTGITHQDQRLAERVDAAGCPVVVLLNKWDLCGAEQRRHVTDQIEDKLFFVGDAPVIRISAKTGKNVQRLMPYLTEAMTQYQTRIPTPEVNRAIRAAQASQPAPAGARVLYAIQGAADPPTFTLFVNKEIPRTYMRYLENQLKETFGLGSTPIKLRVRNRSS